MAAPWESTAALFTGPFHTVPASLSGHPQLESGMMDGQACRIACTPPGRFEGRLHPTLKIHLGKFLTDGISQSARMRRRLGVAG